MSGIICHRGFFMSQNDGSLNRLILITGATGFVGRNLTTELVSKEMACCALVRQNSNVLPSDVEQIVVPDLTQQTKFAGSLGGVDTIIHLAGLAHTFDVKSQDAIDKFYDTNVKITEQLGEQAASSGVRRFIFLSSVHVNGTASDKPFSETDMPAPVSVYAKSKLAAENKLWEIASRSEMEVVVIRPPLIYGPGALGNLQTLVKLVSHRVPMPLGLVNNKRTLCGIDNLIDLIITCAESPAAANELFLAGDASDVSTARLIELIGSALQKPAYLAPVPPKLLQFICASVGRSDLSEKLLGNLQVDISKARDRLLWTPPYSVEEGLMNAFSVGHKIRFGYLKLSLHHRSSGRPIFVLKI